MSDDRLLKSILSGSRRLDDGEVAEAYARLASELSEREAAGEGSAALRLVLPEQLHQRAMEMRALRAAGILEGYATGYSRLDRASGGWRKGELVVVGAEAAAGKTNYVLNCLHNMALAGIPSLFVSLEMGNVQVYDRLAGMHSSPLVGFPEEDAARLPVSFLPDGAASSARSLKAYLKKFLVDEPAAELVAIDHLSLLPPLHAERRLSHAAWAATLREWVKEFDVPIVLIHHLRRQPRDHGEPQMVDLAESQDIVNHADQVYLLQRDADDPSARRFLHVHLKKNRVGGRLHRDVLVLDGSYKLAEADPRSVSQAYRAAAGVFGLAPP